MREATCVILYFVYVGDHVKIGVLTAHQLDAVLRTYRRRYWPIGVQIVAAYFPGIVDYSSWLETYRTSCAQEHISGDWYHCSERLNDHILSLVEQYPFRGADVDYLADELLEHFKVDCAQGQPLSTTAIRKYLRGYGAHEIADKVIAKLLDRGEIQSRNNGRWARYCLAPSAMIARSHENTVNQ